MENCWRDFLLRWSDWNLRNDNSYGGCRARRKTDQVRPTTNVDFGSIYWYFRLFAHFIARVAGIYYTRTHDIWVLCRFYSHCDASFDGRDRASIFDWLLWQFVLSFICHCNFDCLLYGVLFASRIWPTSIGLIRGHPTYFHPSDLLLRCVAPPTICVL